MITLLKVWSTFGHGDHVAGHVANLLAKAL
jgi:hypothetical protein